MSSYVAANSSYKLKTTLSYLADGKALERFNALLSRYVYGYKTDLESNLPCRIASIAILPF